MLHDLYLMSANPSQEAASRRNFDHRALTFQEMAASCTRREPRERSGKSGAVRAKGLFNAILQGVPRA